jgi:uncharacterized protein DUF669
VSALGPLNLSDDDLKGFEALEPGRYNAEIYEVSMESTKNPDGKLPLGTPQIVVQFNITDPEAEGRRVFTRFTIPPEGYDAKKSAQMRGMFGRFLVAVGEDQKKLTSGKYTPDLEDLKGRPCVITLGKREWPPESGEYVNDVKGVKPAGSDTGTGTLL